MKKILVSIATTLMAATVLVACNGDSTNSSDITSNNSSSVSKATCTSLNNWQSVGIGMSAGQVEARLGKPAKIDSTQTTTTYSYERCRGFLIQTADAVPATATTPAVPAKFAVTEVGGVVAISSSRGVTSVTTPERIEEAIECELDYYNYREEQGICRNSSTPF